MGRACSTCFLRQSVVAAGLP
ncbi:hypothetical protein E2C01_079681 [Portunus trituberculatus]|uniref:Uncharacterized protein n=1 Tax=Portunus trituberculatus TaxID=210409 RepID=A0A5B7ITZ7_PORTR|nr:hypothetical protein [Portunus trituberculatus]